MRGVLLAESKRAIQRMKDEEASRVERVVQRAREVVQAEHSKARLEVEPRPAATHTISTF